jgi:hypothetical protein
MRMETRMPGSSTPSFATYRVGGAGEPAAVLLVHTGEVLRVRQQDADLDDVVEGCARCCEDGATVLEGLTGLVADCLAGDGTRRHVHPDET